MVHYRTVISSSARLTLEKRNLTMSTKNQWIAVAVFFIALSGYLYFSYTQAVDETNRLYNEAVQNQERARDALEKYSEDFTSQLHHLILFSLTASYEAECKGNDVVSDFTVRVTHPSQFETLRTYTLFNEAGEELPAKIQMWYLETTPGQIIDSSSSCIP